MTILLDYRPALQQRSGVGEYAHELARALAATLDERDTLLLFCSSWRDRPAADLAAGWPRTEVVDRKIPVRALNAAWHRLAWPPVEQLARRPVDVAQSLHPLLLPTRTAVPVVTIHDLDFLRHPERTAAEIRRDYGPLVRQHAQRAALVVVNSATTGREVQHHLQVPAERIVVCRPGVPDWAKASKDGSRPLGEYVLFVGTLEPRKNIPGLLDAWSRVIAAIPDAPKLRLAGAATPAAGPWLRRLEEAPLAGRVEYVGYVPDASRRALFEGARALVIPSFYEGFGLPALEAMALGIPVVSSDRGALPEVIGDAGLLAAPDDPEALADAIGRVLTDDGLARTLAERGRARAARFSWQSSARTLRSAYDDLLARRPPRPGDVQAAGPAGAVLSDDAHRR